MAEFELHKNDAGQFHFSLKSEGHTLLSSEQYTTKASALNGIESVRKNAVENKRYIMATAKSGKPYFNLTASNGQIIGTSVMHADEAACRTAQAKTAALAPSAGIIEES